MTRSSNGTLPRGLWLYVFHWDQSPGLPPIDDQDMFLVDDRAALEFMQDTGADRATHAVNGHVIRRLA